MLSGAVGRGGEGVFAFDTAARHASGELTDAIPWALEGVGAKERQTEWRRWNAGFWSCGPFAASRVYARAESLFAR